MTNIHAYIVCGGLPDERNNRIEKFLSEWKVGKFDVVRLAGGETPIGIADIRDFERQLALLPQLSAFNVGILSGTAGLTNAAQNAILKTLEEPPASSRIIIDTASPEVLLPTILSRCTILRLPSAVTARSDNARISVYLNVFGSTIGKKLEVCESFGRNRTDAITWIEAFISEARTELFHKCMNTNLRDTAQIKNLTTALRTALLARNLIDANVQPQLAIDMIFLGFSYQ